ncbi:hypothetical protein EJB05_11905, partial [Eragrostis curvula]
MATARSETHRPYSRPPERDLISDLPDDLLHAILAGLRSADAAARTSILSRRWRRGGYPCMWPGCSCKWLDSTEKVALDALEEIVVKGPGEADDKVELVTLLCCSNVTSQKRMIITVFEDFRIKYIREKIRCICLQNDKVEVIVKSTYMI